LTNVSRNTHQPAHGGLLACTVPNLSIEIDYLLLQRRDVLKQ
jgi:hypothetical protein